MGWKIDFQGAVLREEEVTGAQVIVVNLSLGESSWDAINPMTNPATLCMWTALAISEHTKRPLEATLMFVQQQPLLKVLAGFTAEAEEPPAEETPDVPTEDLFTNDRDRAAWQQIVANAAASKANAVKVS